MRRWWRIEFRLTGRSGEPARVVQHTVEAHDMGEAERIARQRADRDALDGGYPIVHWWGSALVREPDG